MSKPHLTDVDVADDVVVEEVVVGASVVVVGSVVVGSVVGSINEVVVVGWLVIGSADVYSIMFWGCSGRYWGPFGICR